MAQRIAAAAEGNGALSEDKELVVCFVACETVIHDMTCQLWSDAQKAGSKEKEKNCSSISTSFAAVCLLPGKGLKGVEIRNASHHVLIFLQDCKYVSLCVYVNFLKLPCINVISANLHDK